MAWRVSVSAIPHRRKAADGEHPTATSASWSSRKTNMARSVKPSCCATATACSCRLAEFGFLDKLAAEHKADDLFVSLLAKFNKRNEMISSKIGAHMYAPTVFAKQPEAKAAHLKKKDFEDAMSRLFDADKIHLEQYGAPSRDTFKLVTGGRP